MSDSRLALEEIFREVFDDPDDRPPRRNDGGRRRRLGLGDAHRLADRRGTGPGNQVRDGRNVASQEPDQNIGSFLRLIDAKRTAKKK